MRKLLVSLLILSVLPACAAKKSSVFMCITPLGTARFDTADPETKLTVTRDLIITDLGTSELRVPRSLCIELVSRK